MADNDSNGAGDGAPQQQQGAGNDDPPMVIRAHYLKDMSFENPKAPQSLMEMTEAPDVQVNVNVDAKLMAEHDYEVSLTITGEATIDGGTVFVVELTYAGIFTLNNVPNEHTGPMLLIEAPRLLFPYARRMISDATGEGGFPPLSIQPIDFVVLYQQHLEAQQAQAAAPPAEA
jgi:preprotein translocase subunit SecB